MLGDNHFHTRYSDGENTLREMVDTAFVLGYSRITVTDHVYFSSDWIHAYIREAAELKREYAGRMEIRIGVEAKITDPGGSVDFNPALRDSIDWVLAAVHRIPAGNGRFIRRSEICPGDAARAFALFRTSSLNALKNPLVDVIAHPFDLSGHPVLGEFWDDDFVFQLKEEAIKNGKFVEYNAGKSNGCVDANYWTDGKMKVWIGSDSHSAEAMKQMYHEIVTISRAVQGAREQD